jgi:serine/threonine protein kinase
LGEGAYARVIKAIHNETGSEVAIKMISTGKLSFKDTERAHREVHIVSILNHPHIVKVFEIYNDTARKQIHLVQELLAGGDLLEYIIRNGPLPEVRAAKLLKGVLEATSYLHNLGYAHRDLKPENLVLDAEHKILKLIDFGFAKSKNDMYGLETPIGTPGWQASDVMRGEPYSLAVDMWSIGCIVYFTLFAVPPFSSKHEKLSEKVSELNELVRIGRYEFPANIPISLDAHHFISQLLEKDPNNRLTAVQALEHKWMQIEDPPEEMDQSIPTDVLNTQPRLINNTEKDILEHLFVDLHILPMSCRRLRESINLAIDRVRETAEDNQQKEVDADVGFVLPGVVVTDYK